jgi:CheY-like chemotaxis protein
MELTGFVRRHAEIFGTASGKLAADLAALLDGELLSTQTIHAQGRGDNRLALMRLEVFEDFCAVCAQCGIKPPELEIEMLLPCLLQAGSEKEAAKVQGLVLEARRNVGLSGLIGDSMSDLLSLTCCLEMMPGIASEWDGRFAAFRAVLNAKLLKLGKPTLRPDYSAMQVGGSVNRLAAPRMLKTLVVDDDRREIIRTMRALAGWPNLSVVPFHFAVAKADRDASPERAEEILRATAREILDLRPDIAIMDEGMPVVNGGHLVTAIRALEPDFRIEFVGSTGGTGRDLREAGALLNLEKGRNPEILEQAIRHFSV